MDVKLFVTCFVADQISSVVQKISNVSMSVEIGVQLANLFVIRT